MSIEKQLRQNIDVFNTPPYLALHCYIFISTLFIYTVYIWTNRTAQVAPLSIQNVLKSVSDITMTAHLYIQSAGRNQMTHNNTTWWELLQIVESFYTNEKKDVDILSLWAKISETKASKKIAYCMKFEQRHKILSAPKQIRESLVKLQCRPAPVWPVNCKIRLGKFHWH